MVTFQSLKIHRQVCRKAFTLPGLFSLNSFISIVDSDIAVANDAKSFMESHNAIRKEAKSRFPLVKKLFFFYISEEFHFKHR